MAFLRSVAATVAAIVVFGLLGASSLAPSPAPTASPHPLETGDAPETKRTELARRIAAFADRTGISGVFVQDIATGTVVYEERADASLIPASNAKIVTTAAALELLGSGYRYETRLSFDGRREGDSVLVGDLLIRGSGDPTFGSRQDPGADPLRRWAEQLAEEGIERIEGRIIGDDDVFADASYPEGWDVSMLQSGPIAVPVSGLSYYDNLGTVQVEGGHPGARPIVRTHPNRYLEIENRARTRGTRSQLRIARDLGTRTVRITGSLPSERQTGRYVPVDNPTLFTAYSLGEALRRAGIETHVEVLDVDELSSRPSYEGTRVLARHSSPPLERIVETINRRSNNFYAEQVFRTLSPTGTSRAAARRIRRFLRRSDVGLEGVQIVDGSGLSRKNLLTPRSVVQLLTHMAEMETPDVTNPFVTSLPAGGERESTLQNRLAGISVRAKTGSLKNVRALSGYVDTARGRTLAFSFITNNFTGPGYRAEHLQNELIRALATGQS